MGVSAIASAAHSPRHVSIGHSWNLGSSVASTTVVDPASSDEASIVGIGIAPSNDHVYVWYADGTVSSGTSTYFEHYQGGVGYILPDPDGKARSPQDIIAIDIGGPNDHVYTWYQDGTVSEGWSQDLTAYQDRTPFTLPAGKLVSDIVGIAIAGSDDHVYAWYSDGTVSEGWSQDLDFYEAPYPYALPSGRKIGHIIDMAIAGSSDLVYTWYHDVETGSGHSAIVDEVDARAMDRLRRYRMPGLSVSISKDGRMVLNKAYGFADFETGDRMQTNTRCRIGSTRKVITALSAMHLHQETDFDVSDLVYGTGGPLEHYDFLLAQHKGIEKHQPIIAKAIASNDRVYTWYHDGTVTSGTSRDPDRWTNAVSYTLAPGKRPKDVVAIGIGPNDWVWAWYDDRTYSAGTSTDLDVHVERDEDTKVSLPGGYSIQHVLDVDFASNGTVYAWYENGMQSAGTTADFAATIAARPFTLPLSKDRYGIRAFGIAKSNDHVYAWYSDDTVTEGYSQALDYYSGPRSYEVPAYGFDPNEDWYAWYGDMRVDHLLSHTSGFFGSGDQEAAMTMFNTTEPALTYQEVHEYHLRTRKLDFAPGTDEVYSNHGMGLISFIIERSTGDSYEDYTRNAIIDPLGLDIQSGGQEAGDAMRHQITAGALDAYVEDHANMLGLGAGGWKSSAGDLVRLMLATDQNPNHPDILDAATLNLMESSPYPAVTDHAHGWAKTNSGRLWHNGGLGGGTSFIAKYPEDYLHSSWEPITVAVCTNIGTSAAMLEDLAGELAVLADEASLGTYDLY